MLVFIFIFSAAYCRIYLGSLVKAVLYGWLKGGGKGGPLRKRSGGRTRMEEATCVACCKMLMCLARIKAPVVYNIDARVMMLQVTAAVCSVGQLALAKTCDRRWLFIY